MIACGSAGNTVQYAATIKTNRANVSGIHAILTKHCEVNTMSTENNSTPSADSRQLSIFTPQFDERIRRIEIEGVTHFSVMNILPERVK